MSSTALAQVTVSGSTGADGTYASLTLAGGAFAAINGAGSQAGNNILIEITADVTTETGANSLNAGTWTTLTIRPSGGAARTISGSPAAGTPLINLAGASNVTIDGLNTGGNALTISNLTASATAGTSTIRLINGASNNTIRNATILGSSTSATATAGGNILISTSTVAGGNSNNLITGNNLGPAGANLPTKTVLSLGSAAPNANTNNTIDNNNIFDFFSPTVTSAGISISTNNTFTTITNNRIYQTAPRTFTTTGLRYNGILVSPGSTGSANITGNVIGFGAADGTGTTTISGLGNTVNGIQVPSTSTTVATSIQGNTISGFTQTTSTGTTGSGSGFIAISVGATAGLFNIGGTTGNTIGSQDGSSGITVNCTTTTANSWGFVGIFDFSFQNLDVVSNNTIGTITINNGGTGTGAGFRGIRMAGTTGQNVTINNNIIGGTAAGSITDNVVGTYNMYGIDNGSSNLTCSGNLIRNIVGNAAAGGFISISGIILTAVPTGVSTISQNTVHSLHNNGGATNGAIYAIYGNFPATANVVERNLVHSLTFNSTNLAAQLAGIIAVAGTGTYKNNMVRLGRAPDGTSVSNGYTMYGMFQIAGLSNFYHNSVYIGGTGANSASNTFAFVSNVTTGTREYLDNIFYNGRDNAGTGKNYAITLAGLAGATSNNNVLYAPGTNGFVGLGGGDQLTLANWQTATGQDSSSLSADPQYIAPDGDAATGDLHIHPTNPTPVENTGVLVASVVDDFDGQIRASLTPVDIGADASNFTPIEPFGACCLPTGCEQKFQSLCTLSGGTAWSEGVDCASAGCPATGQCCAGDGSCSIRTQASCIAIGNGAVWNGGTDCSTPCLTGSCCVGVVCSIKTQAGCDFVNGVYGNDGSTCPAVAYPLGQVVEGTTPLEDISADPNATQLALGDDTSSGSITVPFTFSYYGNPRNSLIVNSNGWISFNANAGITALQMRANAAQPSGAALPNEFIAPYWDDLNQVAATTDRISHMVKGTAPYRRFIVQWNVRIFGGSVPNCVNCEVILYEGSHCIEFRYATIVANGSLCGTGGTASFNAGLEDLSGTVGTNVTALVASNKSLLMCPSGGCPAPTGACCVTNTACQLISQAACQMQSGIYNGDGSDCDPDPCVSGACCLPAGGCQNGVAPIICTVTLGGNYRGDFSTCETLDPPCPPSGACCSATGTCSVTTQANCSAPGQSWSLGGTCTPNPCQTGACCQSDGSCSILTQAGCTASGGVRWTSGAGCSPNLCRGRCCAPNGDCSVTFPPGTIGAPSCEAPNAYLADGTDCSSVEVFQFNGVNMVMEDVPAGVVSSNVQTITSPTPIIITDLNVDLRGIHTWPGDVTFRLEHLGTMVVIYDRPGVPASTFGCATDDFDIILDDEGTGGPIENVCNANPPSALSPPNYTPNNPLSAFDGMDAVGDWTISCVDGFSGGDTGTLLSWSLHISSNAPVCPVVGCTCFGDMNGDSVVDGADIAEFTACVVAGGGAGCACADMDHVGGVDANDVDEFVAALLAGTCGAP